MSKGEELVQEFDECAMSWGWTQDQGSGVSVGNSQRDYNKSRADLLDYVQNLEAALAMLEKQ